MDQRLLTGSVTALAVLLLLNLGLFWFEGARVLALETRAGSLPLLDIAGTFVAMAIGGAIAGARFQWVAVAISLALWVLTFALIEPLGRAPQPPPDWAETLRFNAMAIVLTLLAAWAGAWVGARRGWRGATPPAD